MDSETGKTPVDGGRIPFSSENSIDEQFEENPFDETIYDDMREREIDEIGAKLAEKDINIDLRHPVHAGDSSPLLVMFAVVLACLAAISAMNGSTYLASTRLLMFAVIAVFAIGSAFLIAWLAKDYMDAVKDEQKAEIIMRSVRNMRYSKDRLRNRKPESAEDGGISAGDGDEEDGENAADEAD